MTRRILLAAGGTGGHIVPAIAFGQWLQKQGESVVWLTGSRQLERDICAGHGVEPLRLSLEGSPLGVSGMRALKRWKSLFSSYFEARAVLKKEKIDCCVLFGGYLSLPVLLAARHLHIPIVMHEQNTVAGKVTRIAAKMGVPITCAWPVCRGLDGTAPTVVGMPLRQIELIDRREAQKILLGEELPEGEKLIVILGGSLGSGGMKSVLQNAQDMIKSVGCRILCMGIKPEDRPFPEAMTHAASWDMAPVYSAADVVVCRAGAATLAELQALHVPAIVVPWPKAADNHQVANAECFSRMTGSSVFMEGSSQDKFRDALAAVSTRRDGSEDLTAGVNNLYKALCSLTD